VKLCGLLAVGLVLAACGSNDCARTSVGATPLSDLHGFYKRQSGGLYSDGTNAAPASHLSKGVAVAHSIGPLDATGHAAAAGRLAFISIGMSNTTQEFSTFTSLADTDPVRNPELVIVDGAQNGFGASLWALPTCACWRKLDGRLRGAGVTPHQVVAAWIKLANTYPTESFPVYVRRLRADITAVVVNAKRHYPNLRLAYLSSRAYAGFTTATLNPEPYAYESAFAVREVIQAQITGNLNFDLERGEAIAPWLAWGPYLWADGVHRRSDGFTWACEDFASDGTHPSESGRLKVAHALLAFLKSDPTARLWFSR
jgi:hypothetical protein